MLAILTGQYEAAASVLVARDVMTMAFFSGIH